MLHHVILWKIKEEYSEEEKKQIAAGVKKGLEGLPSSVPSIQKIRVVTDKLPSSTCDVMLDSWFADEAGLKSYATHPAHVAVANEFVRPFMEVRMCMDYIEE